MALIDPVRFPEQIAFARQQLNHMVRVEEVFQARLMGEPEPHATSNSETVPSLEDLRERLSAANEWLQDYAQALSPDQLEKSIHFGFLDGASGTMTRGEVLFHLINHGTYHRGAIGRALDQAGGLRPADTYTVYIHGAEPERRGNKPLE